MARGTYVVHAWSRVYFLEHFSNKLRKGRHSRVCQDPIKALSSKWQCTFATFTGLFIVERNHFLYSEKKFNCGLCSLCEGVSNSRAICICLYLSKSNLEMRHVLKCLEFPHNVQTLVNDTASIQNF